LDFTRSKVLNVIALLAVIFFLRPLLDGFETVTVKYLGFQIQLNFIYYSITGCLALAAYLYALEAVAGTPVRLVQQLGNAAYALAILMPPAYVGLLVLHLGNHFLTVKMMAPDSARLAWQIDLTVLVVAAGYFPFRLLRRRLREKDTSDTVSRLSSEETSLVSKVNGMFEAGLYELVPVEAFRAVEVSLRKLLIGKDVLLEKSDIRDLIDAAEKQRLIGTNEKVDFQDLRLIRNGVLHEGKEVDRDTARQVIDITRKIVIRLDRLLSEEDGGGNQGAAASNG
jgi:HEPN domain-containing protein